MPESLRVVGKIIGVVLLSLLVYAVPIIIPGTNFFPIYPIGVLAVIVLAFAPAVDPVWFAVWATWHGALTAFLILWRVYRRDYARRLAIGTVVLSVGSLQAYALYESFKDQRQEMVETRLPEIGTWEQVCQVESYRLVRMPPTLETLAQGLVWVEQRRPRKLQQLNASTCVVESTDRAAYEHRALRWTQAVHGLAIRCSAHPSPQEGFVCDHYYGPPDVIEWDFNGLRGKHEVRSSGGPASAAVNRAGTLIGIATGGTVGHYVQAFDSVYVLRAGDGEVVFYQHLDPFREMFESPVMHFLGDRYFAYSFDGIVRVFAVPEGLHQQGMD